MARHVPFYARRWHLPPPDVAAISDWEEKVRQMTVRLLTAGVSALSACPSWAILLFKQMQERAAAQGLSDRIGELWPKLSLFVSYGMAFEPYRGRFEEYVGRALHYVDTYSSSEAGMTAIQEEDRGPLRLIVDNGVFFEFVPAGKGDRHLLCEAPEGPFRQKVPVPFSPKERLHIGEVEEGRDYSVLISSNGGIWSYPLGDVIRFVSLRPPRIVFTGRTEIGLNAFGEHVTLGMIENAVAEACRRASATVADYTVAPSYPTAEQPKPVHRWFVEFDRAPANERELMTVVDQSIRSANEDYDTHRTGDFGMDPPRLVRLTPGTFYAWMKQKGKLGGQQKVPRVAQSEEMVEELLALSCSLSRAGSAGP